MPHFERVAKNEPQRGQQRRRTIFSQPHSLKSFKQCLCADWPQIAQGNTGAAKDAASPQKKHKVSVLLSADACMPMATLHNQSKRKDVGGMAGRALALTCSIATPASAMINVYGTPSWCTLLLKFMAGKRLPTLYTSLPSFSKTSLPTKAFEPPSKWKLLTQCTNFADNKPSPSWQSRMLILLSCRRNF